MIWAAPVIGTVAWEAAMRFGRAARTFKPLFVAPRPIRHFTLHEEPFALGSNADLTNRHVRPLRRPDWTNPFVQILQERKEARDITDAKRRAIYSSPQELFQTIQQNMSVKFSSP